MLIVAASVAFATAAAFYPAIAMDRKWRRVVLWLLVSLVLLSPLMVPPDREFSRLLAAVLAVTLAGKLYDLHIGAGLGHRPGLWAFFAFLPNPASMVLRKLDDEPRPSARENLARLLSSALTTAPGAWVLVMLFRIDWGRLPFAVERSAKVVAFFLTLVPGSAMAVAALRLVGGRARDPMHNPFAARSPADFWKRYNRPAQQFFYEDVFKPLGGLRSPVRATLGTFAVSAVIHEFLFVIALGRLQGFQTAFFLLQGLAVAATLRVRPTGWRAVSWLLGTLAFNLVTSTLFFASIGEVVEFYSPRASR